MLLQLLVTAVLRFSCNLLDRFKLTTALTASYGLIIQIVGHLVTSAGLAVFTGHSGVFNLLRPEAPLRPDVQWMSLAGGFQGEVPGELNLQDAAHFRSQFGKLQNRTVYNQTSPELATLIGPLPHAAELPGSNATGFTVFRHLLHQTPEWYNLFGTWTPYAGFAWNFFDSLSLGFFNFVWSSFCYVSGSRVVAVAPSSGLLAALNAAVKAESSSSSTTYIVLIVVGVLLTLGVTVAALFYFQVLGAPVDTANTN